MILPFLITNDLFGYVDRSIPCPSKTITGNSPATSLSSNLEYSAWISNDAHIRMLLLSTISEASFKHVQGNTSCELWLALERAYAPHTSSREYTLKTQLLKIEMKPEETSADYITRVQQYAYALLNIGEPMKEKDVVMLAISGLREEYNSLKPTLISRQPSVTLLELPSLLADHEYMVKKADPIVPTAQAFMATSNRDSVSTQLPPETVQSLQQLLTQLGLTVQPAQQQNQALYTNRGTPNRGSYGRRGRARYNSNNPNSRQAAPTTGVELDIFLHDVLTVTQQQFVNQGTLLRQTLLIIVHKHHHHGCRTQVQVVMCRLISMALTNPSRIMDTATRTILLMGPSKDGLYSFQLPKFHPVSNVAFSTVRASPTTWHQRLGHPHSQLLKSMISKNNIPATLNSIFSSCNSCPMGKSSKMHLSSS